MTLREMIDQPDFIKLDVPLLIRLLEWAREDAESDVDLHIAVEHMVNMNTSLTMAQYEEIVQMPLDDQV